MYSQRGRWELVGAMLVPLWELRPVGMIHDAHWWFQGQNCWPH